MSIQWEKSYRMRKEIKHPKSGFPHSSTEGFIHSVKGLLGLNDESLYVKFELPVGRP